MLQMRSQRSWGHVTGCVLLRMHMGKCRHFGINRVPDDLNDRASELAGIIFRVVKFSLNQKTRTTQLVCDMATDKR